MTELETLREELRQERLMRLQAQDQALEASIVASTVQRNEVRRLLKEMGWPPEEVVTQGKSNGSADIRHDQ